MSTTHAPVDGYLFNSYRDKEIAPTFDKQGLLCVKLADREVNPTIAFGVNALTLRLLLAQEALRSLKDYEQALRARPGNYTITFGQVATSGVNRPVLSPGNEGVGEVIKPESIRVHQYFYAFVSSAISVLDRLANELNDLYELRIKKPDWGSLISERHRKALDILRSKDSSLANLVVSSNSDSEFIRLHNYRHVSEHRGAVRIDEFSGNTVMIDDSYTIKVQDDPTDPNSPCTVPLIQFTHQRFAAIVGLCDQAYGLILGRLN